MQRPASNAVADLKLPRLHEARGAYARALNRAASAIAVCRYAILTAIIVASVLVAGNWAVRVPFFQNPDEAAHADYAFALYDAGRLFRVERAHPSINVMQQTQFLARAANYRKMRYNVRGRLPDGYGSASFFRSMSAREPARSRRIPAVGSTVPYVMFSYPPLYYIAIAVVMTAATSLAHSSLVVAFFAARFFGIACLAVSSVLAFRIFRLLNVRSETALLAVFAFALLPTTSAIASAIQPDNLAAVLVNATLYLLLRYKIDDRVRLRPIWIAIAMAALGYVKLHYALAILVPALMVLFTRRVRGATDRRAFVGLGACVLLPLAVFLAEPRTLLVTSMQPPRWTAIEQTAPLAQHIITFLTFVAGGISDNYLGGHGMESYWMKFGVRAGSVYDGPAKSAILFVLAVLTCTVSLMLILRQWSVLRAIGIIARRRAWIAGLRLVANDVLLNTYVLTTVILLGVYALTNGEMTLQGRYWYPVLVPTLGLTMVAMPRILSRRFRRQLSFFAALSWACYAGISCPTAIAAREKDYYGSHAGVPQNDLTEIQSVRDERGRPYDPADLRITDATSLTISGWAIDAQRGLPASTMTLLVDGKSASVVSVRMRSYDVFRTFNDPVLMNSGFRATVGIATLTCGLHRAALVTHERRIPAAIALAGFSFVIERSRCHPKAGASP